MKCTHTTQKLSQAETDTHILHLMQYDVLMDDSVFNITVQDGSHMIQNGGDTPRPSMRSVLTINYPNRRHEGSYMCSVSGGLRTIKLEGELQKRMG